MRTLGFTASGVCDRTNLNMLRQYIGHSCGPFLRNANGRVAPSIALAPHFSTGDDGLRAVPDELVGDC